jgi:hypothetical protein
MDPGYVETASVGRPRIKVEPLFPFSGTAAFLFASRESHGTCAMRATSLFQATSKEPIET